MKVSRILKFVLIGISALLVVAIVGAVVAVRFIDFNRFKPLIAEAVLNATGRELTIAGDVRPDISLTPGIVIEDVRLANAEWGSRPDMVSVRRLEVKVALLPLLSGVVEIDRIELVGADLLLETDRQGRANFAFDPPPGATAAPTGDADAGIGAYPSLPETAIRDSRLTYKSAATGATYGTDIDSLALASGGPDKPIDLTYAGDYNGVPVRAKARLGALAGLLEPAGPWPVDLTLDAGGAAVAIKGAIAEPLAARGFDLAISARGDQFGDLSALAGAEIPSLGAYSLSTRAIGDLTSAIALPDLRATLGDSDIAGDVNAALAGERTVIDARLNAGRIDLAALGTGLKAPLHDAAATVSVVGGTLEIKSFTAGLSGATVTAAGTIAAPLAGNGLDLAVAARGKEFGDLSALAGADLPALGAYSLSVAVTGDAAARIRLGALQAQIGASDLAGEATVTPGGQPAIAATLASRRIDLAALGAGLDATLQDSAATLSLAGGNLEIASLETSLAGATVTVTGTIADAATFAGLDLAVAARGDRFAELSQQLGGKALALGAYSLAARVTGDPAAAIDISGLAAQLGGSDIAGDARVTLSGRQPAVDAQLTADRIDLAALGAGNAPLRGTVAVLALKDGKLSIESVEGTVAGATVKVAGSIAEPAAGAGLDLTISARGRQFGDLSALAGAGLPARGKYAMSARVTGDAAATIRVSAIDARVGDSDLGGEATVTLTGPRPAIDAGLTSNRIDLAGRGGTPGDAGDVGPRRAAAKPARIFSDDPLPLAGLKAVDADLRFYAATVTRGAATLRNAFVDLSLRDGLLEIGLFKVETRNGALDGAARIDGRREPADLAVRLALGKVDLATMLADTRHAGALEGQANVDVDLTGRGNSVRQIMASLDGRASLAMGQGRIRSRMLQTWVGGPTRVLGNVLTLNLGGYTRIHCALGVLGIENGVATSRGSLLDTDVAAFVGSGTIDLRTEALGLTITPVIKKMTLSAAVPVHVRGTLARPAYSLDNTAVARRVGGVLGGLVFPPALILGLGEMGTFGKGDCAVGAHQTDGTAAPDQAQPATGAGPARLPGKILKGTGERLKGLFGR